LVADLQASGIAAPSTTVLDRRLAIPGQHHQPPVGCGDDRLRLLAAAGGARQALEPS